MKRIGILIAILIVTSLACSQEYGVTEELTKALKVYDEATDSIGMKKATHLLSQISDNNKKEWLAAYWASYLYSQTGRLLGNKLNYYTKAQLYIDRAWKSKEKLSSNEKSELHALQSLIYSLTSDPYWRKGDRENGMKYSNLKEESLNQAIIYNDSNPRTYILAGTGLISDGRRNSDYGYILAGRLMLEAAREKYESNVPVNKIYPYWGKEWIKPWLSAYKIPSGSSK